MNSKATQRWVSHYANTTRQHSLRRNEHRHEKWRFQLQAAFRINTRISTLIYVKRSLQPFHSYSLCRFHTVYRPLIAHSVDSDQTDSCLPLFTYRLRYLSPVSRPKYKTAKRIPEWEYRTSWVQPFLLLTVLTALLLLVTLCRTAIRHC